MKRFKRRKNTRDERIAFWQQYQRLCGYCEKLTRFSDMTLDHVIPISTANDTDELQRLLALCGKPPDYDLNDFSNLVPCCHLCNREKTNQPFSVAYMVILLRKAARNAKSVQKRLDKMRRENALAEFEATLICASLQAGLSKRRKAYLRRAIRAMKKCQRRITLCLRVLTTTHCFLKCKATIIHSQYSTSVN